VGSVRVICKQMRIFEKLDLAGPLKLIGRRSWGDHALPTSPANTGLEFALGVSFRPWLGNLSIRTYFGPKKRGEVDGAILG
jgi:hypothetical protein